MRVLITRPEEDATRIADILKSRGHEPVIAPLLRTNFHDGPEVSLDGVQAILATSANGVRALVRRTPRRDVPLFAVGPQTEEEAHGYGFASLRNANGDSKALAAATREWASPGDGTLLHVKGAEADGTLATLLKAQNFDVRTLVLYDVADIGLSDATRTQLANGEIDAALFFSARSARIFRDRAAALALQNVIAICISAATADALSPLTFREIRVAEKPNQDALLVRLGS
jgi:uroporphyrinogen-III synthase